MNKSSKGVTLGDLKTIVSSAVEHAVREKVPALISDEVAKLRRRPVTNYGGLLMNQGNLDMEKDTKPGIRAARVLRCLAAGGGDIDKAVAFAKKMYGSDGSITKALGAGDAVGGGFLIADDMADEVIDLLRPRSIVRAMEPQIVEAPRGTKTFPKLTTGASASYLGENQEIAASQQQFGQVNLVARKLAGLVPISNELIEWGSAVNADEIIRDDLVQALATAEDVNLLRGDGLEGRPRGLRKQAHEDNITGTNGTTATQIESDFKDLLNGLDGNNVPNMRRRWLMAPRSKNHLFSLRDANGNLIFPELRSATPRLYGNPVLLSNNIPTNLGGGGNETEVYLVEASEVLFGEVMAIRVAVNDSASYTNEGGTLVSAFTHDQTLMRAILHHDIAVKHSESIAIKTGVTWGA